MESMIRRHVFHDLRPYVCTFQNCSSAGKLYVSRNDWMYHELQIHRRQYACKDCEQVYSTKSELEKHLPAHYGESLSLTEVDTILELCGRQVDVSAAHEEACLICGIQLRLQALQSHLAEHMEDISLFVLSTPSIVEEDDQKVQIETIPIIQLRSLQDGEQERCVDDSPERCASCGWDGKHEFLYETISHLLRSAESTSNFSSISRGCSCCQITDTLRERSGLAQVMSMKFPGSELPGQSLLTDYEPFIPSSTTSSPMDRFEFPRRKWTAASNFFTDTAEFAKNCLRQCLSDHPHCGAQREMSYVPTRLIDVGGPDQASVSSVVKLRSLLRIPQGSQYAALSYLWPADIAVRLTRSLEYQWSQELPVNLLPATIQDAIAFTRALGIQYLWVDALCMFHPEHGGMERENSSAPDIFRNAVVVLEAAWGDDATTGLRGFSKDSWENEAGVVAHLELDGSHFPLYLPKYPSHPVGVGWARSDDFHRFPLFSDPVSDILVPGFGRFIKNLLLKYP